MKMKKLLAVVLALVLVLSMTACGSKETLDGSWKLTSFTQDGKDMIAESGFTLADFEANGVLFGLTAKDGKATITMMDEPETYTYDDKTLTDSNNAKQEYKINNGVLTLEGKDEEHSYSMTLKKMTDDEAKKFASQTPDDVQKAMLKMLGIDPSALENIGEEE
jgi:hypothetical protein